MKQVFYKKVGRRYVPVAEYDNDLLDSFTKGNHLVMCYPGGTSRRFNIDPAYAPLIAASRIAADAICSKLQESMELRPTESGVNQQTQREWTEFVATVPDKFRYMFAYGSIHDAVDAGLKAMIEEANILMKHQSVQQAYDQFMLICELTKENSN